MAAVKIMTDPNPLIAPPNNKINSPSPPKTILIRISCFTVSSFSSVSIKLDTNMEFINMATKSEDPNTTDKVIGK